MEENSDQKKKQLKTIDQDKIRKKILHELSRDDSEQTLLFSIDNGGCKRFKNRKTKSYFLLRRSIRIGSGAETDSFLTILGVWINSELNILASITKRGLADSSAATNEDRDGKIGYAKLKKPCSAATKTVSYTHLTLPTKA